jgi:hypothetical protein
MSDASAGASSYKNTSKNSRRRFAITTNSSIAVSEKEHKYRQ